MKEEKHSECAINYEWFRCSSKDYGLTCDTCSHYNPEEDADKVKLNNESKSL